MKLRQSIIGVHHHDCWGSLSTEPHPDLSMVESGPILVEKVKDQVRLTATWHATFDKPQTFKEYVQSLDRFRMIKRAKVIVRDTNQALLKTTWTNDSSTYDTVFKNDCLYASPVTQKDGYEIYTILSEHPQEVAKLMNELEEIGQVKLFKAGNMEMMQPFTLTDKQLQALQVAYANNFYSWPRTTTLEELARKSHLSRRAFQEHLRKAEMKLFPQMIQKAIDNRLLLGAKRQII